MWYSARDQRVQPMLPGVEALFCHRYGGAPCQDEQVLVVRLLAIWMDTATRRNLHQRQPPPWGGKMTEQVNCGDPQPDVSRPKDSRVEGVGFFEQGRQRGNLCRLVHVSILRRHEFYHEKGQFLVRRCVTNAVPRPTRRNGQESRRNAAGGAVGRQNPSAPVDVVDLVCMLEMRSYRRLLSICDRWDDYILHAVPGMPKMHGDGQGFVEDDARAS